MPADFANMPVRTKPAVTKPPNFIFISQRFHPSSKNPSSFVLYNSIVNLFQLYVLNNCFNQSIE